MLSVVPDPPDAPSPGPRWAVLAVAAVAAVATAGAAAAAGEGFAEPDDAPAVAATRVAAQEQARAAAARRAARTVAGTRSQGSRRGRRVPPPTLRTWAVPEVDGDDALARLARRTEARELSDSTRVRDVLRRAALLDQIDEKAHDRHLGTWEDSLRAVRALPGRRAEELGSVVKGVQRLADGGRLSASRLEPVFLMLGHNVRLWRTAKLPERGDRRTVAGDALVLQYYPGYGWQLQPLATWGKVNALAARCLGASQEREAQDRSRTCPQQRKRLRERLDTLLDLAVLRGGRYPAWEYVFSYAGASPPWVSAMAQAAAAQALARAGSALDSDRYRDAAREVVGTFEHGPPLGVAVPGPDDGTRYALYSFRPDLHVLNAELQAVLALRDVTKLTGDTTARELYLRGDRALRAVLPRYDTGAWSRYSAGGREATAGYHRLQRRLLGAMCERTDRGAYCASYERFRRYEGQAPDIDLEVPKRARTGREVTVRFTLSKTSKVALRVTDNRDDVNTGRVLLLPRGVHEVRWSPSRGGRHTVRVEARGPTGPEEVAHQKVRVADPKSKGKSKGKGKSKRKSKGKGE